MMAKNSSITRRARVLQDELNIPLSEAKRRVIEADKRAVDNVIPEGHPFYGLPFTDLHDLIDNTVMETASPLIVNFGKSDGDKTALSIEWAIAQMISAPPGFIELYIGIKGYISDHLNIPKEYRRYARRWSTFEEGDLPESILQDFSKPSRAMRIMVIHSTPLGFDVKTVNAIKHLVNIGNAARRYIVVEGPAPKMYFPYLRPSNGDELIVGEQGVGKSLAMAAIVDREKFVRHVHKSIDDAPHMSIVGRVGAGKAINMYAQHLIQHLYPMVIELTPEQSKLMANEFWAFTDEDTLDKAQRDSGQIVTRYAPYYAHRATEAKIKSKITIADVDVHQYLIAMVHAKGWVDTDSETRSVLQPVIDQIMEQVTPK